MAEQIKMKHRIEPPIRPRDYKIPYPEIDKLPTYEIYRPTKRIEGVNVSVGVYHSERKEECDRPHIEVDGLGLIGAFFGYIGIMVVAYIGSWIWEMISGT